MEEEIVTLRANILYYILLSKFRSKSATYLCRYVDCVAQVCRWLRIRRELHASGNGKRRANKFFSAIESSGQSWRMRFLCAFKIQKPLGAGGRAIRKRNVVIGREGVVTEETQLSFKR